MGNLTVIVTTILMIEYGEHCRDRVQRSRQFPGDDHRQPLLLRRRDRHHPRPAPAGKPNPPLELARACLADPRIGWISITDNPGGTPMLPPDWLGGMVRDRAANVVVHLTCKDMNRNGLEAAAWRYAGEGFDNLLAITGDYPTAGYGGLADPVFDLDSVGLVSLLRSMNEGLKVPGRKGAVETLSRTNFFIGCVVSPFKRHENELLPQYLKLLRKIRAGTSGSSRSSATTCGSSTR